MRAKIYASRSSREIIERLLKKTKSGLTVSQIEPKIGIGKRQINNILKQLILEGKVNAESNTYPPKYFYISKEINKINKKEVSLIEKTLENFLRSKSALVEGKVFAWGQFINMAFQLKIDHTKPEFKSAVINLAKQYKFRWLPGHEPPK